MDSTPWDPQGEAQAALRAIVSNPRYGIPALSNTQIVSNTLKDYLPDSPREAGVLAAASEAGLARMLQEHVARGLDAGTATRLVAASFASQTAFTPDACDWAARQFAAALGLSAPEPLRPAGPGPEHAGSGMSNAATMTAQVAPGTSPAGAAAWDARPAGADVPYFPASDQPQPPRRPSRTRNWILAGGAAAVAIVVVVVVVLASSSPAHTAAASSSSPHTAAASASPANTGPASSAPAHTGVVGEATNVPVSVLAAVAAGTSYSQAVNSVTGTPLTEQGKPELLYIGATFCPYCEANQWAMVVAFSRFGTFSNLQFSRSAPSPEEFPNTATLSFYGASYSSPYFVFTSVENEDVNKDPLQPTTAQEQALWLKYDPHSYPFLDIGNSYVAKSLFNPQVLQGLSQPQIAAALGNPSSPIAQAVDGSANLLTAAICQVTGGQPASVCTSPTIVAEQAYL
jgi:hypothetical protein